MKALAIILFVAVFIRHGAIHWLADLSGYTPAAVSYMMGGVMEIVFAGAIALVLSCCVASRWRNLAVGACTMAAIEGAQMTGCRLAVADIRSVPANSNLCEYVTGLPVGSVMLTLYLLVLAYAVGATRGV